MNDALKYKLDLFAENKNTIAKGFKWDNSYLYPACSLVYTDKGMHADVDRLRDCCSMLKHRTGVFSPFRGVSKLALSASMAVEEDPEGTLEQYITAYKVLKGNFGLSASSYLPFAASIMVKLSERNDFQRNCEKAQSIFKLIKKDHPMLTSGEDSAYAVLFALSNTWINSSEAAAEVERCYQHVKSICLSSNSAQSLAFVLAISPENAEIKCKHAMDLYNAFKKSGHKFGTGYELPSLGILSASSNSIDDIVNEVCEADDYLKGIPGFSSFKFGAKMRLMYASVLTASQHASDSDIYLTTTVNSITNMIIAQQAALTSAMIASSAAAASVSSSAGH